MPCCVRPCRAVAERFGRGRPRRPPGVRTNLRAVLVLAVDTATEVCLAAVGELDETGGVVRLLASRAPVDARRHGELLAPLIGEVLAEVGARPAELGGIVVGLGPGPFTSLRVGVVTAASLGDVLGVRAVGVCTLDAIAGAVPAGSPEAAGLLVATDARRREVYWARYAGGVRVAGPSVERPAVLAEQLKAEQLKAEQLGEQPAVAGSGAVLYPELGRPLDGVRFPDPLALLRLGVTALLADEAPGPLVPLYLRRPDAVPPGAPKSAQPERAGAR